MSTMGMTRLRTALGETRAAEPGRITNDASPGGGKAPLSGPTGMARLREARGTGGVSDAPGSEGTEGVGSSRKTEAPERIRPGWNTADAVRAEREAEGRAAPVPAAADRQKPYAEIEKTFEPTAAPDYPREIGRYAAGEPEETPDYQAVLEEYDRDPPSRERAEELEKEADSLLHRAKAAEEQAEEYNAMQPTLIKPGEMDWSPEEIGAWQQQGFDLRQQAGELNQQARERLAEAELERQRYAELLYSIQGREAAEEYLRREEEQRRLRETTPISRALNTLGGTALNLLSGTGSPLIALSRIMEMPEDALYALTKNERFNQDNPQTHPGGRNSEALRASDQLAETAAEMKERAGPLGGWIIDAGKDAGSMLAWSGIGNAAMGTLGATDVVPGLESIADASPLAASPAARTGAQLAAGALKEIMANPGNTGISFFSGVNGYSRAIENGAAFPQALTNGLLKGTTEYLSNKLFAGTPFEDTPEGKSYAAELAEHIAEAFGKSEFLQKLYRGTGGRLFGWLLDKFGEGLEEVITGIAGPLIDRITYDRSADLATAEELTEDFLGGVLLSLLMSGGKKLLSGNEAEDNIRERTTEKEQADGSAAGARPDVRTLRGEMKDTLDTFQTDLERALGEGDTENAVPKDKQREVDNAIESRMTDDRIGHKSYEEIESGGHHYQVDPTDTVQSQKAASTYNKIVRTSDIRIIAGNTGFTENEITTIKRHVFFNKHRLYDGYGRFVPDYDMAVAWKRLQSGKYLPRDITLLQHELLESIVEKEYNLSASEAHARATEKYDWWGQLMNETGESGEPDGLL